MLHKGIPDIRLLRSDDPRVATQMLDLAPYRPVSYLPAIRRDLSVAVDAGDSAEDLGDRVRDALGDAAAVIEEIAVLSETPYGALPAPAIERLGMAGDQKNVLVRLVIRPFKHTLTDADANAIRDRVYAAVHQGSVDDWASRA
jgi:phenylalanyl-tRNA synthetase alpha chain